MVGDGPPHPTYRLKNKCITGVHIHMTPKKHAIRVRTKPRTVPPPVINLPHWIERVEGGLFETIIIQQEIKKK